MDQQFALHFQRLRRLILLFDLIFLGAALGACTFSFQLSSASTLQTGCFVLLAAIALGTQPLRSYLVARRIQRWKLAICPFCRKPLWDNVIVVTETAIRQKCPHCDESLRWQAGFPVLPPPDTSSHPKQSPPP